MKPLETNQRVMTWLYGVPPDDLGDAGSKWRRIAYPVFILCVILTHLVSVTAGFTFIFRILMTNKEEALFSLFHTVGGLGALYQAIIFDNLMTIYNESEREF